MKLLRMLHQIKFLYTDPKIPRTIELRYQIRIFKSKHFILGGNDMTHQYCSNKKQDTSNEQNQIN